MTVTVHCSKCGCKFLRPETWIEVPTPVYECPNCGEKQEDANPEPAPATPSTGAAEVSVPADTCLLAFFAYTGIDPTAWFGFEAGWRARG